MIIPAIDLLDGQSVRLLKGDFNAVTKINLNPVAQAQEINRAGLSALHVVDLNGSKDGAARNFETILALRKEFVGFMEVGGGIRTLEQIETYYSAGIDRVILGSVALKNPVLVKEAVAKYGDFIAVGIDGDNGRVATEGWLDQSDVTFEVLLDAMLTIGVKNFIVTDVARDGTLQGPNLSMLSELQHQFSKANIIASGGIAQVSDLADLRDIGIQDVIVGKALATGNIKLAELVEMED